MADWTVGIDRCKLEYETAKYTLYLTITGVLWNAFRQNHRLKKTDHVIKKFDCIFTFPAVMLNILMAATLS